MSPTELLAIDTILPTILGLGGLLFVAASLWPIGREWPKRDRFAGAVIGSVGVLCLAASVWLWLVLLKSETQAAQVQLIPGTNVTTSVSVPNSAPRSTPAQGTASAPAPASVSAAAVASASASAVPASSGASSSAAASGAPPSSPASPAPSVSLSPVAAVAFQPDTGAPHGVTVSVESFEHGFMIYRSDTQQIYVLNGDKKQFKVYPDTWTDVQPDLGSLTPVAGKYHPSRGFGKLWNTNPDVKQTLGLALTPEQGLTGRVSGDATSTTIQADATYVFNKNGAWSVK